MQRRPCMSSQCVLDEDRRELVLSSSFLPHCSRSKFICWSNYCSGYTLVYTDLDIHWWLNVFAMQSESAIVKERELSLELARIRDEVGRWATAWQLRLPRESHTSLWHVTHGMFDSVPSQSSSTGETLLMKTLHRHKLLLLCWFI